MDFKYKAMIYMNKFVLVGLVIVFSVGCSKRLSKPGQSVKVSYEELGLSSKGYYRLAKTKAVQMGLNNDWLTSQGLISVQQQWSKFHYS